MSQLVIDRKASPLQRRGTATVSLSAMIYPDQAERLKWLSDHHDVSQATIIRIAIQQFLDNHPESVMAE